MSYNQKFIVKSLNKYDKVNFQAEIILKDYDLCDNCLGRLFSRKIGVSSNKLLGRKIHQSLKKKHYRCYICKNLLEHLESYEEKLIEKTSGLQFSSFLIGAILKPSLIDHDDLVRSKFKLRGIDSIKTDITKEISKKFARKTKASIEHNSPDLIITINFKNDSFEFHLKSVFIFGRYLKTERGFTQKQKQCENCNGVGCRICQFHGLSGFDSVEGKISQFLYKKFGAKQVKISWIGGEDKSSIVLGNGRPFFAKIINPAKRKIRIPKKVDLKPIVLQKLKTVNQMPKEPIKFKSIIELSVNTENEINPTKLKLLKNLKKSPIIVYEKFDKRNEKKVYSINYKKTSSKSFSIHLKVDGGLPIKKFVDGDNISPTLTDLLDTKCRCKVFDFHQIDLQ
ncbi:MAG: tRNA pseudouridine(54/55) synthase Pus10 [Nitrosopumilaceae archaeon]